MPFKQIHHGGVDRFMGILVKIRGAYKFNDLEKGFVLQQDGSQDCLLGFNALRRDH